MKLCDVTIVSVDALMQERLIMVSGRFKEAFKEVCIFALWLDSLG